MVVFIKNTPSQIPEAVGSARASRGWRFKIFQSENQVVVTIADNGIGIPKENLKYIFEPFFSTKSEFGTGLGLSITREIVEKLGGKIEVESEIGKGTVFTVTLIARSHNVLG